VGWGALSTVFVYSSIDVCFLRELNDGGEGGRQLGKAAAIDPETSWRGGGAPGCVLLRPALGYYYPFGKVSSN